MLWIRKYWPIIAALIAFACLCAAWFAQYILGMAPCPLCYTQRYIYWAAIGTGGLMGFTSLWSASLILRCFCNLILVLVFAIGVYYAGYHAGVEWGLFAPPGGCSGTGDGLDFSAPLELDVSLKLTNCIDPPFRILGLSMAGWNILVYLALMLGSIWASFLAWREQRS